MFSLYYPTDLSLVFARWVQPPVIVQGMSCWRSYLPSCPVLWKTEGPRVTRLRKVRYSPWGGQGYPLLACECIALALLLIFFLRFTLFMVIWCPKIANLSQSSCNPKVLCSEVECQSVRWDSSYPAWCLDKSVPGSRAQPTCKWIVDGA